MKRLIIISLLALHLCLVKTSIPEICNDPTSSIINLNTTNFQFFDLENNSVFCVVGMGHEAHIIFDGSGPDPPTNWTVIVALPSVTHQAYVDVIGTKGTNGVVSAYLPGVEGQVYNVTIYKPSGPTGSGYLSVAGLKIEINHADHLSLITDYVVNVNIDGTPGDCEVISVGAGSIVSLHDRVSNSILVNNATTIVPASVTAKTNQSLIFTGSRSHTIVDYSNWNQTLSFSDACLVLPNVTGPSPSAWFLQQAVSYGMTKQAGYCQLKTFGADTLNITSSSIAATGLGNQTLRHLIVHSKNVTLTIGNETPFDNLEVAPGSFAVKDQFDVVWPISPSTHVFVDSAVLSPATTVRFLCSEDSGFKSYWTIGTNGSNTLEWKGKCQGILQSEEFLPLIAFDGEETATATLTISNNTTTMCQIVLMENSTEISYEGNLFTSVESLKPKVNLEVNLNDWNYTILLDLTKKDLLHTTWKFNSGAFAKIISIADVAIGVQPKELHFDHNNQMIRLHEGDVDNSCFQPLHQCTRGYYTKVGAYGEVPCYTSTEETKCTRKQVAVIYADKLYCPYTKASEENWTLTVNKAAISESTSTAFEEWTWITFLVIFILFVVASIVSYILSAFVFTMTWTTILLNSDLVKMSEDINSVTLRSFIDSGDNAANSFTGWVCGIDSVPSLWGWQIVLYVFVLGIAILYAVSKVAERRLNLQGQPQNPRAEEKRKCLIRGFLSPVIGLVPFAIASCGSDLSFVAIPFVLFLIVGFCLEAAEADSRKHKFLTSSVAMVTALTTSIIGHPDVPANNAVVLSLSVVLLTLNLVVDIFCSWQLASTNRLKALIITPLALSFGCGISYVATLYAMSDAPTEIVVLWFGCIVLALVGETLLLFHNQINLPNPSCTWRIRRNPTDQNSVSMGLLKEKNNTSYSSDNQTSATT